MLSSLLPPSVSCAGTTDARTVTLVKWNALVCVIVPASQ